MKKKLTLATALLSCLAIFAQSPEVISWKLNTSGHQADYEHYQNGPSNPATPVQLSDSSDVKSVCYDNNDVYITANGLASYTMGPFVGNPNVPSASDYTFKFPRVPMEETGTKRTIPAGGAIAVGTNGVVFFGYGDARSYNDEGVWDQDAWVSEGSTMDGGAGHPTGSGTYHYHSTPLNLYSSAGTAHSPVVGYAFDGYPIYGPFGYSSPNDPNSSISRMTSGYSLRNITTRTTLPGGASASSAGPDVNATYPLGTYIQDCEFTNMGDLDQYNGRTCVTPEYPGGTYAYFITTDINNNPAFPYVLAAEYYGVVTGLNTNKAGNITQPSGLSCYDGVPTSVSTATATDLRIYPNPVVDIAYVVTQGNPIIQLFDLSGTLLHSGNQKEISTRELSPGVYILKVGDQVKKFVKK